MFEVGDVEDVACTVDDMEATDRLLFRGNRVREQWNEDSGQIDGMTN
jgi:hypothetical protein